MGNVTYRPELQPVLHEILGKIPGVTAAKMFGLPGYHVGKKFFAVLAYDGVSVKLPPERIKELLGRPDVIPFEPMPGRAMNGWVVITHADPAAYKAEVELFDEAIAYVASLAK